MNDQPHAPRSATARVVGAITGVVDRIDPLRGWFLWIAAVLFVAGAIVAISSIDIGWSEVDVIPMAAIAVLAAPTVGLAAAEFWSSARMTAASTTPIDAVRVAITSTAMNLLPLPGGAIVRTQSLRRAGTGGRRAFAAQLTMAFIWLALASWAGGIALAIEGRAAGWVFGLAGAGASILALLLVRYVAGHRWKREMAWATLVELGFVVNASLRLMFALLALGVSPSLGQPIVLAASSVMSSFVAMFPAGLGVRELFAAGLAPLVGLPAATGFLAAALVRAVTMLVYIPLSIMMGTSTRKRQPAD